MKWNEFLLSTLVHKLSRARILLEKIKGKWVEEKYQWPVSIYLIVSLFFSFRIYCYQLCTHRYFVNTILIMICCSSILLAAEDPLQIDVKRNNVNFPLYWPSIRVFLAPELPGGFISQWSLLSYLWIWQLWNLWH